MLTPDRGALRLLRSGVLAVGVLALSAGAHALAGGHLPATAPLAALAAAVWLGCWAAGQRRLSASALTGLLAVSQTALHAAFEALSPDPSPDGGGHAARAVPAGLEALAAAGGAGAHHHATALWVGGPTSADAAMLVAHAAAALALALVCARGEDVLWDLCAWLAPLAAVLLATALPAPAGRPRRPVEHVDGPRVRLELTRQHRRRGPPRPLAA